MMNVIEIIGLIAGGLTVVGYLPQVVRTVRTRDTKGLSLAMFAIIMTSAMLWMIYGFGIESTALVLTNSLVLICAAIIMGVKIYEEHKKPKIDTTPVNK